MIKIENTSMKIYFFLLLFLMPFTGKTQNPYEKDLRAIHAELVAATERMDIDKILDYTFPQVFKIAPRAMMKKQLVSTMSGSDDMKIKITKGGVDSVGQDILETAEGIYAIVYEYKQMQITVKKDTADKDNTFTLGMMQKAFESSFGEGNVRLDKETSTFTIDSKKSKLLCFNPSATKKTQEWKLLQVTDSLKMLETILDKKIISWLVAH